MDESTSIQRASEAPENSGDCYFPPYITLAHIFNAPKGWEIKPRSLLYYQFQYVVEGAAEYWIDDQLYITRRGDLIYHSPDVRHSVSMVEGMPYVCLSLLFHFGRTSFPIQQLLGDTPYLGNFSGHAIENRLSQLIAHFHQPGLSNQILCQSLLMQIIHELSKSQDRNLPKTKVQKKTNAKLILIRNYIAENYHQEICHKDLEAVSGLSRNYIIIKFKNQYAMTPFEYLTLVRVERAKELAIQTNLSISEIAQLVGFSDVHTFGRMFKHNTGMSLSEFSLSLVMN